MFLQIPMGLNNHTRKTMKKILSVLTVLGELPVLTICKRMNFFHLLKFIVLVRPRPHMAYED